MRILLTSPSMGFGGAERVVAMLVASLAARGHEVALIAPHGALDEDLRGVAHVRLELEDHGRDGAGAIGSAAQVAGAIRRVRPDVIHAQNVKAAVIARAAAAMAIQRGRPGLLTTFHGVLPSEYRRAARLLRTADHVACVSDDLLDGIVAAGLPRERASLIRNAVPLAAPLDAARRAALDDELGLTDAPVVTIAGRLVPQKAHERFVVAARRVVDEMPDARLLIVGEGPLRQEIERRVQAAGLGGAVQLTGGRSDAREIMARSDVVVFSSSWEGLSIAALEALAANTPVVSTDVQGMRELLTGGAGAVVPLDDGVALGERLLALLRDPDERARMGRAGRALIQSDHSLLGMVDAYESLYESLAGGASGARSA
jgi:glycosyltransferase involved in cell wall biosynthesis